jgi:hypothetical protein
MRYVVRNSTANGGYREASRALAELRAARRELNAERRKMKTMVA